MGCVLCASKNPASTGVPAGWHKTPHTLWVCNLNYVCISFIGNKPLLWISFWLKNFYRQDWGSGPKLCVDHRDWQGHLHLRIYCPLCFLWRRFSNFQPHLVKWETWKCTRCTTKMRVRAEIIWKIEKVRKWQMSFMENHYDANLAVARGVRRLDCEALWRGLKSQLCHL